jgi:hypothetical protein
MKSYNHADTKVSTKGGRVVIDTDIKRRMRTVVNALTFLSKGRRMVPMYELVERVQKQDTTHSYSYTDILYALRRCMNAGLISNPGWGVYQLTVDPKVAKTVVK